MKLKIRKTMRKHIAVNIITTIFLVAGLVFFLPALVIWGWFTLLAYAIPIALSILSVRIKANTWGYALLGLSAIKTILFVIILGFLTLVFGSGDKRKMPADAQMIEHFKLHETLFEELRNMIDNDTLSHYPPHAQDKRDGIPLSISHERELEYISMLKEIQIEGIKHYWWRKNSIQFTYFEKGSATWGIEKGFEYVFDRANEEEKSKVFTDKELHDFVVESKLDNCTFYKKINANWNLYIEYDR
jgi:hypothetical protein